MNSGETRGTQLQRPPTAAEMPKQTSGCLVLLSESSDRSSALKSAGRSGASRGDNCVYSRGLHSRHTRNRVRIASFCVTLQYPVLIKVHCPLVKKENNVLKLSPMSLRTQKDGN